MGHEVVVYGVIVGASYRPGDEFGKLQDRNERIIRSLKRDEDWPWVDLSIFSLPGPYPLGSYRRQIIHFGLSLKDDPSTFPAWWDEWLGKFEAVLTSLYWTSVRLHVDRDFEPARQEYAWVPTAEAAALLRDDFPRPVASWERSSHAVPGKKLPGT
jgi:hypothetical protein